MRALLLSVLFLSGCTAANRATVDDNQAQVECGREAAPGSHVMTNTCRQMTDGQRAMAQDDLIHLDSGGTTQRVAMPGSR